MDSTFLRLCLKLVNTPSNSVQRGFDVLCLRLQRIHVLNIRLRSWNRQSIRCDGRPNTRGPLPCGQPSRIELVSPTTSSPTASPAETVSASKSRIRKPRNFIACAIPERTAAHRSKSCRTRSVSTWHLLSPFPSAVSGQSFSVIETAENRALCCGRRGARHAISAAVVRDSPASGTSPVRAALP